MYSMVYFYFSLLLLLLIILNISHNPDCKLDKILKEKNFSEASILNWFDSELQRLESKERTFGCSKGGATNAQRPFPSFKSEQVRRFEGVLDGRCGRHFQEKIPSIPRFDFLRANSIC